MKGHRHTTACYPFCRFGPVPATDRRVLHALDHLEALAERRRNLDAEIRALVDGLRATDLDGTPAAAWAQIARALGVSRQAVQQKFGA